MGLRYVRREFVLTTNLILHHGIPNVFNQTA
jgi:hypothetical protein